MALVEFHCEPISLDVNEVCFEEKQDISNTCEQSRIYARVTCSKVEALGYFQLLDMRYDDGNVVTERVSTTVLQLP